MKLNQCSRGSISCTWRVVDPKIVKQLALAPVDSFAFDDDPVAGVDHTTGTVEFRAIATRVKIVWHESLLDDLQGFAETQTALGFVAALVG